MYQPPPNPMRVAYTLFLQYQYSEPRIQTEFDNEYAKLATADAGQPYITTAVTIEKHYFTMPAAGIVEEQIDPMQVASTMLFQYRMQTEEVQMEFKRLYEAYTDRPDFELYYDDGIKAGHLLFEIGDAGAYFANSTTFPNCFYFIGHPSEGYEPRESVLYEIAQVFKDENGKEKWTYYPNCQSVREAAYLALLLEHKIQA
jgi:hypothetical protein